MCQHVCQRVGLGAPPCRTLDILALRFGLVASLCACAAAGPPNPTCAGARPPARGLVVVSAADARYADKELAVLVAARRRLRAECFGDASASVVSYDLGLRGCFDDNRAVFAAHGVELRRFNFSAHPPHVATLGCYAWKAPIVRETAERFPGRVVVWLDSGLEFGGGKPGARHPVGKRTFREVIARTVAARGFLSDWTQKTVASLTHEGMLGYFEEHFGLRREAALRRHAANGSEVYSNWCARAPHVTRQARRSEPKLAPAPRARRARVRSNGAFSAHLKGSERYETITEPWVACSLAAECVCPRGSGRHNHRQDQSALTLLAIRAGVRCGGWGHERWVATHAQRGLRELLKELEGALPRVRPSATCPATEPGVTYPATEKDLLPKRR